jgi:hypothetical protein
MPTTICTAKIIATLMKEGQKVSVELPCPDVDDCLKRRIEVAHNSVSPIAKSELAMTNKGSANQLLDASFEDTCKERS